MRYERDVERQTKDFAEIIVTIKSHDEFIRDIKPLYAKGMIATGAFVLGMIGLAAKWAWDHIRWGS